MSGEQDLKLLQQAAEKLVEHFDTVQIFATRHNPEGGDGTISIQSGRGNWYARYGQVVNWVVKEDEESRSEVKSG